jgi:hypothetical protein
MIGAEMAVGRYDRQHAESLDALKRYTAPDAP